jgi:predicted DNA-binding transcriptional regulator YafY
MRASRLVSLLLLLQARGQMTASQLAEALEVSVRTIYRDVESLSAAGVPLYGDAGPAGGYRLLGSYQTRLTGLTPGEAEALFLTGLPSAAAELGLGAVVATAQLKLQAALPRELRDRAARIRQRFHVDPPGWYYDEGPSPHLTAIADAVWRQRRIEVIYRRWAAPTDVSRTLDPHGLVLKAGKWYLVARSEGQLLTYRASQVLSLTTLDEHFERVPGFDLAAYWSGQTADFRKRLQQGEATIRLSPAGQRRIAELLGSVVIEAVKATATPPDKAGWVTAVVPIESLQHAESEFLRLGAEAEVLAPDELRDQMSGTAQALAGLYRPGQGTTMARPRTRSASRSANASAAVSCG